MNEISHLPTLTTSTMTPAAFQRRVSADSFRRLTSLLKKAEPVSVKIPEIFEAPTLLPVSVPVHAAPVAPILVEPTIVETVHLVIEPEAAAPLTVVELEQLVELPVEGLETAEQPEPQTFAGEPEIQAEPVIEVFAPPAEILAQPVQIEVNVQAPDLAPAPTLRSTPSILRRKQKRDEFAEVIAVPKTAPAPPALSPAQEAEESELARSLIDMMSGGGGGGQPHERTLAADTLLRKLPRLPQAIKVVLAQRLAMMDGPPPFLVSRLLADSDIAVSGPLLEDCMQIADENLFPVIAQGRVEQLRLIARRRRLSRAVTEALVKAADASVLLTLVRNAAAEIPQEGFSELTAAAAENVELLPPLCIRQDLPIHIAFELFWLAPAQLRRYLLTRFLTDSETLTRILRITMKEEEAVTSISVEEIGAALEMALVGKREEAALMVAAAVKITPATVERIFADSPGEALMALLKVTGVSRADLEANLPRLADGEFALIDKMRNPEELQAVFDQLSFTKARILLTYWDWATTQSGPYARRH